MQKQTPSASLTYQYLVNASLKTQSILNSELNAQMFVQLIGDPHTPSYWGNHTGYLHKLHMYYTLFATQENKSFGDIEIALNLALKTAKQCQQALLQNHSCSFAPLKQLLYNITFIFIQNVECYAENHFVLFFILRKHEQIDTLYGKGTVERIFLTLFSKGLKEASQYLLQKFSTLGYTHLIPSINEHFSMIGSNEL